MSSRAAYTDRIAAQLKFRGWAKILVTHGTSVLDLEADKEIQRWRSRAYNAGRLAYPKSYGGNPVSTSLWTQNGWRYIWATVHNRGFDHPNASDAAPLALHWGRDYGEGHHWYEWPKCPWCGQDQLSTTNKDRSLMLHQCFHCGRTYYAIWLRDAREYVKHQQFPDPRPKIEVEYQEMRPCGSCPSHSPCRCAVPSKPLVELKGKPITLQDLIDFVSAAGNEDVAPTTEVDISHTTGTPSGNGVWRLAVQVDKQPEVVQVTDKVTVTRPPA